MASTRYQYCEAIQRALAGGFVSDDSELTIPLINFYLNSAIGYAIKANYKEEIQLNGVEAVSDAFYATFTGMNITKDNATGWYNISLPQQTVGVGAGWDISSFIMVTGSGAKIIAYPITNREIAFLYETPAGCKDVFFWTVKDKMNIHACKDLTKYKGIVTMLVSQSTDLNESISVPDGYMPLIVEYMTKTLGVMMNMQMDISSDGVDTPKIK
jgi:hypothetical protein